MEDRGLRDIERWRDKIEVRLDNRQVFFLFFGSALVACMLFVLGVIVGKRLESRGRAVSPEIEDPLALLDKVATSPRPTQGGVTFPQALFGTSSKVATSERAGKKAPASPSVESSAEPAKPVAAPAKSTETAVKVSGESKSEAKSESKPRAEGAEEKQEERKSEAAKPADKPAVAAVEAKPEEKKPQAAATPAKPKAEAGKKDEKKLELAQAKGKPGEAKEAKPGAIPTIAAGGESKGKGRFALQLSSFQDKAEAEAFAQKFAGERPYMVMSDIPGKGVWYRVRVGDYASAKDAMAAKDAFEKKHNVIAYVAQK